MRMWMVDPFMMCDRHLLGEHVECHMFAGTINKGRSIRGFIEKRLLEPAALIARHNDLSDEMKRRGMKHQSDLPDINWDNISADDMLTEVDYRKSAEDLVGRCRNCSHRFMTFENARL